jgi:hypothetical protein
MRGNAERVPVLPSMMQSRLISLSRKGRLLLSPVFAVILPLFVFLAPAVLVSFGREGRFGIALERLSPTRSVLTVFGRHLFYYSDLEPFLVLGGIIIGTFLASYILYPELGPAIAALRLRWGKGYTPAALALTCVGLAAFILHYGNRQWGGFDFSFLIDIGWRQVQGQLPYRDFICTMPPGFYLGLKYAFQLFGVRWEAVLLATAIFSCATFLWIYFLLAKLLECPPLAYFGAIAMQCAAMLTVSFWWYNNVTAITAAVFFLSCVLYLRRPDGTGEQISYVASLALLGLMKPNIAFPMAAAGVLCTLVAARRVRLLVLTFLAIGINIAFLAANHLDVSGMIASYLAVAGTRGLTAAGIELMAIPDFVRFVVCLFFLAVPLLAWWPRFQAAVKQPDGRELARTMLLLSAPVVSIFAMFTNMDLKDVEWPLLFCFGLILLSTGWPDDRARLARIYFSFMLALVVSDLCLGAARFRVALVGDFFSTYELRPPPALPFFGNLKAGPGLQDTVQQLQEILPSCPRPVFFGPRMEFAYAAFGLPSPAHLPVGWTPGTTFPAANEPAILQAWQAQSFATLIFWKRDFTNYSPEFLKMIQSSYEVDDSRARLTVFRRCATTPCSRSKRSAE